MHECPECSETCDCDGEDTWFSYPYNLDCTHECEPDYEDDFEMYPLDDDGNEEIPQAVKRSTELRNEVEGAVADDAPKTLRTEDK